MAQTGFTPILVYASGTATNVPLAANLTSSASGAELALNYADGKLYFKNSSGVVTLLASSATVAPVTTFSAGTTGFTPSTATSGAVTLAGTLATTNGGTGLTSFTANRVFYSSSTSAIGQSANLTFDGTTLTANALTTTSTVTINGGTANGVAYLNGSKVLTTGSALTFDGTVFSVNGGANGSRFAVKGTGAFGGFDTGAATDGRVEYAYNGTNIFYTGIDSSSLMTLMSRSGVSLAFGANGSEQMRLTSTGLGIGTSSPSSFSGYTTVSINNATNGAILNLLVNGTETARLQAYSGIFNVAAKGAATNLTFETNGSERMRLDSSGNLGLGVTPSAWSGGKAVEVGFAGRSLWGFTQAVGYETTNAYYNGGFKYGGTGAATAYAQDAGSHIWYTAPSGTAGNAISFTQAMTLDASGNLGVGTTSPVNLSGAGDLTAQRIFASQRSTAFPAIGFATDTNTGIDWPAADTLAFNTGGTERARIDSSGNLLVGTTSPLTSASGRGNVTINGTDAVLAFGNSNSSAGYIYAVSTNLEISATSTRFINFLTNGSERARITSGGYFKASDTGAYIGSTGAYHELVSSTGSATAVVYIRNTNATSPGGIDLSYSAASPNGTGNTFLYCQDSTALRMSIRSNGGIANYSANNVNLSDRREKTNFAPAKSYLDTICAIPVQTFNYIDQSENDPGLTLGVVAQDVQAVAPELVMESNWGTEDNPKMRLSIYQTDLQYALMKALQELKAEFDAYKATHP